MEGVCESVARDELRFALPSSAVRTPRAAPGYRLRVLHRGHRRVLAGTSRRDRRRDSLEDHHWSRVPSQAAAQSGPRTRALASRLRRPHQVHQRPAGATAELYDRQAAPQALHPLGESLETPHNALPHPFQRRRQRNLPPLRRDHLRWPARRRLPHPRGYRREPHLRRGTRCGQ